MQYFWGKAWGVDAAVTVLIHRAGDQGRLKITRFIWVGIYADK